MAEKHTVAMFVQEDNGGRIQVGWASPKDGSGVRTFEYSPGFENTQPKDVSFEDDDNPVESVVPNLDISSGSINILVGQQEIEEADINEEVEAPEQPQTRRELRENEENN